VSLEVRRLIREMSIANPLWGRRESMASFSSSASMSARRQVYGTEAGLDALSAVQSWADCTVNMAGFDLR
jgi:hypothetical protein